jgi:hypothetical protein
MMDLFNMGASKKTISGLSMTSDGIKSALTVKPVGFLGSLSGSGNFVGGNS